MTFSNFFDSLGDLDWLAILAGAVVVFLLAWVWYGPLFGKAWLRETGQQQQDPDPAMYVKGFIVFLLLNIGIAYFIPAIHVAFQNPASIETLIVSSLVLAFFIVGTFMANRVVWEGASMTLWSINFGFVFLAIAIGAEVQDLIA